MKKFIGIAAAATVLVPSVAFAETQLHAYEYAQINAPSAKIWKMIEGFDGMQQWHSDVAEARIIEGAPGEVGSVREVRFKDGTTVLQELTRHDHNDMRIDYRVVGETPWGLKDYRAVMDVVQLQPGQSVVIWRSSFFKDGYAGEADVVGDVQDGYQNGLYGIKTMAESG